MNYLQILQHVGAINSGQFTHIFEMQQEIHAVKLHKNSGRGQDWPKLLWLWGSSTTRSISLPSRGEGAGLSKEDVGFRERTLKICD